MRRVLTAAAVLFACPAMAQLECQPAGGLHEILAGKYGKRIVRASECTQSWSIVFYQNANFACVLAVGADTERDG